jgi:hypothetical protein
LGAYLPESQFDTPLDYEAYAAIWAVVGHGGIVVFDDTVDMAKMARYSDGVLRDRILRQMHALPDRLDARCRGRSRSTSSPAAIFGAHPVVTRPLRHDC